MKRLFTLVLGAMATVLFVSCQEKQNTTQIKATYSLTLAVFDDAVDQQEVVKTVVKYKDNQGTPRTEEFLAETEEMTLTPLINFSLPYNETITIVQTLKDVSLTKEKYELGLDYSITVSSVDDNGGIYGTNTLEMKDVHHTVMKENMEAGFPQEIALEISVDAKGVVAITVK